MLTFIPHKIKQLNFDVTIEGIDQNYLEAKFTIIDKTSNISYSIIGEIKNDKINFTIPPLNSFILVIRDNYDAKLEIVGNKYYLQPWNDSINIFKEPIATATIINSPESLEPDISAVFMSRDSIDVEEPKSQNCYTQDITYEEKIKHPEKPQDEIKPHKLRQYDAEKKKQMKKIFEE